MNLQKLNVALNQIGADKLSKSFSLLGQKGQDAFYQMTKSALTTNMQLKNTNTFLNKMGTTLINTLKWTFSSSLINRFVGAVQQAVGYVEHLDSSLNDIRIVTKKSADEMEVFGQRANDAAKALGKATTDYTEAALIYYQQGLSDEEVKARAETTLKAANVTGQATKTVSEQLTAVWNGFRVGAEQTEEYVDKLAAVAAISASNLEELSTGMSKVASAASNLGVDIDQLTAQISTIVSVTRQAPESVGTALKTIYARISDLKLGESDEDGLGLGDVSGGLKKLGIDVLDSEGELRNLGTVIEEVAGKWDSWTSAQQAAIAQLMAGKRQYNNLVALFSNWDMYTNAIEISRNATGELQKQQDIYMDSTEAHLQQLKTEWEDFYDSLIDPKAINNLVDSISKLVKLLTNFIDGIGGGGNALLLLGSTALRVFDKQIGAGITHMIQSFQRGKENAAQLEAQLRNIELFKQTQQYQNDPAVKALLNAQDQAKKYYEILNNEQINEMNNLVAQVGEAAKIEQQWKDNTLAVEDYMKKTQQVYGSANLGVDKNNRKVTKNTSEYKAGSSSSSKMDAAAEERFKQTKNDIESMTKSLKSATSQMEKFQQTSKQAKKVEIFKNIKTDVQALKDSFNNLNQTGILKDVDQNKLQEIEKYLNQILNSTKGSAKTVTAIQKLKDALQGLPEDAQKVLLAIQTSFNQDFSGTLNAAQEKLRQFQEAASLQNFTTNVVNSIGAVGQFAGSINALTNAFDILQDNTVSAGEKILRLISSIGMSLPMLISSIGRITESISGKGGIISGLTGIILKHKLAGNAAQASAAQMASAATTAKLALMGVSLGITAIITSITLLASHYQKIRQEAIDRNKNIIEEANKTQELIDKNKDTTKSLEDLIDQYKSGAISAKEFNDQKLKLIQNLDDEAIGAFNAAQGYKEAREELEKYKAVEAEKTIQNQKTKINSGMQNVFASMESQNDLWEQLTTNRYVDYDPTTGNLKYTATFNGIDFDAAGADNFKKALDDIGLSNWENGSATFTFTPDEKGLQELEAIAKIIDQFKDTEVAVTSDTYQELALMINRYRTSDAYKDVKEAIGEIESTQIEKAAAESKIAIAETKEEVDTAFELFKQYLQDNTDLANEDILSQWRQVLAQSGGKIQQQELAKQTALTTMVEGYYANFKGDKTTTQKYGQINEIYDQLIEKGFTSEQITALGTEYWKNIVSALAHGGKESGLVEQISNDLTNAALQSMEQMREGIQEKSNEISSSVGKSISDAIAGNLDVTSEEFTKLLSTLDEVKQAYPELTNEIETFSNQGLVGTEHWIQAAYKLQEAIDKIEFANLNKKVDEAKEKLDNYFNRKEYDDKGFEVVVEADTEKFSEAMQELMDAEYQIDVEVHSDAERDFDQLVDSMRQADELASKIGEDFIVAADDIRELNNVFPGILEGIQYLGDGTIQLNEEIVQSAMNAANQQEIASTEELNTKLENAATELRAKAVVYDTMADIAHQASEGQISEDEYQSQIAAELDKLDVKNDGAATEAEITNAQAVTNNSNENAKISAENWTKSYQQAADASFRFAQNAIENAKAAAAGPNGVPVKASGGNFNFTWSGSGGQSSSELVSSANFEEVKDFISQAKEDEAKYRALAESARAGANDIEGMIAEAAAKLQESVNKNRSVGQKKSSGSGGKSSSSKEPEKLEYLEREEDIYRVVNQELEQIESQLNNIDKINSHQWGANYKKTLEQQNELLKQQTTLLEKKNKLQIDDLATRRKQLEDEGLKFSEDGAIILNAEEYLNELYAEHNKLIDAHNNMTAAEQEVDKANLETSENRIKAVEKRIEEYEALRKEADDVYSKRLEQHYAEIENEVEIFNAEVDLHLELKDAEKEWNDFWKEVVEDVKDNDFAGQIAADMKQLDTLIGVNSGFEGSTGEALLTHIQKELAEVDKTIASAGEDGLFGDNIKLAYENLVKYRDQLMATLREAKEKLDHMAENYVKQLEYSWELIDKQVERFETIGKHINHNIELIKLVDGEKAYDALDMQYENQYKNNLQLLDTLNKSKDIAEQEMNKHKALMEQYAEGTTERETAEKAYESSVNEYLKITEQLDSTLEDTLQSLKEQTENTNAKILDTLDKVMSGGIGLDLVEEEWKLINDEADKYYDNVERYINMEEYTHQLNEAADAIGLSAANQQKLNQFREEELKQLNEKERLTSYDIEESRARLEILKQELALQDAQANKSKMRLRRDTQGNYNYQYVADENAIEEAENGLLTAKKEWYSLVKKRYQDLSNDIISIQKQQLEYAKQIKDAESAGDIERLNKYKELYNQNAEYLKWAMTEAEKNKRDMYNGTQLYFKQVDDTTLEQSKTTVRQLVDQWAGGGEKSFTGAVKKAIEDLDAAQETFKSKTATALSAAGVNYNNLKNNNIDPVLAKLNSLTDKNLFDKLSNINKELENQWKNLEEGAKAYRTFREAAVGELGLVEKEIKTLSQLITNIPSPKLATPSAGDAPKITYDKGSSNTSNSSSSGGDTGGGNRNPGGPSTTPEPPKKTGYILTSTDKYGGNSHQQIFQTKDALKKAAYKEISYQDRQVTLYDAANDKQTKIPAEYSNQGKQNMIQMFRSGGYTGSWGSNSGRWALLHQKELVLNENDTKNMLSAVQILRSIPYSVIAQSLINSSTNTASALSGINSGISGLAAAATNNESKTMVVNADFSGVHDADEIYQALLELENYGLQNSYSVAPHANSMY